MRCINIYYIAGSITAKTDDIVPIRCIPHRDAEIRSIESCMTTVTTAAAGKTNYYLNNFD
jgi:hypothetical protein